MPPRTQITPNQCYAWVKSGHAVRCPRVTGCGRGHEVKYAAHHGTFRLQLYKRCVLCSPFRTEIFRKTLRVQEGGRTFLDSKNAMVAPRTNVTIDKHNPVKKANRSFSIREEQR